MNINIRSVEICGDFVRAAQMALECSQGTFGIIEVHRLSEELKITHEIKDIILNYIPIKYKEDIRCNNPDVFRKSRKDDTIVLRWSPSFAKNNGRSRKVETDVKASDFLSPDKVKRIPIMKLAKYYAFEDELFIKSKGAWNRLRNNKNAIVFFVRVAPREYEAFISE